jgi:hypothetical protein
MVNGIAISVQPGDALRTKCDVLAVKYAQALYGVDAETVSTLEGAGISIQPLLPKQNGFRLIPTNGAVAANRVLFVGVSDLRLFDYAGIRAFAMRTLSALAGALPSTRRLAMTVHGVGYGLDESESFRAELAGLLDALESGDYPAELENVVIIERNTARAARLSSLLEAILPAGVGGRRDVEPVVSSRAKMSLADVGEGSRTKRHIFAAMPFAKEFDDRFHYGIQRAAEAAGFLCERADLTSFVGDVLDWVRERISTASLVVADLTTANPNVYLEVGYAWGRKVPTVLLVCETADLKFDVRGQRCLVYSGSIRQLEESLTKELKALGPR